MDVILDLAKNAYDAYGKTTDYKNFMGNQMPGWDDLPVSIQQAWCASVISVVDTLRTLKSGENK